MCQDHPGSLEEELRCHRVYGAVGRLGRVKVGLVLGCRVLGMGRKGYGYVRECQKKAWVCYRVLGRGVSGHADAGEGREGV